MEERHCRPSGGPQPQGTMDEIGRHNHDRFDATEVVARYRLAKDLTPAERLVFHRAVPAGARVLDLGVGTGRTTPYLRSRASTYVGIDVAPTMVEAARADHPEADLRVGDAADLSEVETASVDVVVFSYNGIDYLSDAARARCLREVHRVLDPGGRFVLSRHDPRAVLVAPGNFEGSAVRRTVRSTIGSVRRLLRLGSTSAFWTGRGWVFDPASGGLRTHMATPRHVEDELRRFGFEPIDRVGAREPRSATAPATPWWYYTARVCP